MGKAAKGTTSKKGSPDIGVIAEGIDEAKRRYFLLGEGGEPILKLPPILASRFSDDQTRVSSALTNAGFNLISSTAKTAFFKSVQEWSKKDPSFKVATRIGWHGENNYVLPGKIFGPSKNLYASLAELDSDVLAKYRVRNSLSDWQEHVGKLCVNNSRLIFAVALAFTGPILRFVQGDRSGGFQIYGEGEKGKSTAAMVAGSVWGCHLRPDKGFMESWNTTANKVELTAFAHNDGLLILDETENAGDTDPQRIAIIKTVIFRLAEQIEKNRLTNAEARRSWRCYFLSTSNYPLVEMASNGKAVVSDAYLGRLVDIPLPESEHGIYEDLHGVPSGKDLTDHLKSQCRIYYGVPIREFISKLSATLQRGNDGKLKTVIRKAREQYLNHLRKQPKYSPTLNRASAKFATVYVAGALAIHFGVLNWNRDELRKAILKCQLDGLARSEVTTEVSPIAATGKKLVGYIKQNQAKFIDLRKGWLDPKAHEFGSAPGYIAIHKDRVWYYLTAEKLESIIGTGRDASRYKKSLADKGRLDVGSGGQGGKRFVVERRIFQGKNKEGWKSVHAIKYGSVKT